MYSTTDWNGHRKYKSDHRFCEKWPLLHKRINHQKVVMRHVLQDSMEKMRRY